MVRDCCRHRDHAIVEQVIAELKDGPLAHAPSGKFTANAAWLTLACLSFNVLRAAGAAASTRHARARCGHPAHPPHRPARPDRDQRPPDHPPPAPGLAVATRLARPLGHRHSPLTTRAHPAPRKNPTWKSRTDRPIRHAHTQPAMKHQPESLPNPNKNHDRWIRVKPTTSSTRSRSCATTASGLVALPVVCSGQDYFRTLLVGPGLPSVSCAANWGDLETRLNGPVRERQETPDHVDDRASMWTVLVSKRAATEGG